MKFTLFWMVPPIAFTVLMHYQGYDARPIKESGPLAMIEFIWFGFAVLAVFIYWVTRIFRRATRDSGHQQRPYDAR